MISDLDKLEQIIRDEMEQPPTNQLLALIAEVRELRRKLDREGDIVDHERSQTRRLRAQQDEMVKVLKQVEEKYHLSLTSADNTCWICRMIVQLQPTGETK